MSSVEQNFAHRIERQAAERPGSRALVMPSAIDKATGRRSWIQLNFGELDALADRFAAGLVEVAGVRQGDRVLMMVKPGFDFFALSFALWKIGAIPVLIDPGMGIKGLMACIEQVAPRVLMGIPAAMIVALVKRRSFASVEVKVTVGPSAPWGGVTLPMITADEGTPFDTVPVDTDTEAAILFTSGSTGPAKGVRYTHGMFGTQAERIQARYGIQAGEIDVPCFVPFAMFTLTMGMTVVMPEMDFAKPATARPEALIEAVTAHGAQSLVGSPVVMRRMALYCAERELTLPSLTRVLTFGAPFPRKLHAMWREILNPGVEIHTPYGATEALPVASIATDEILTDTGERTAKGEGTCVGSLYPDTRVAIIPITEDPIPEWDERAVLGPGEIGEICVRGEQVSTEYKERPDATAASKIHDGQGFWHRMGDLGYLDEQGRLWFCGRKKHRVPLQDGSTLFPVRLEGVFNEVDGVARSALVGVDGAPVLVVEPEPGTEELEARLKAAAKGGEAALVQRFLFHPSFPVDKRHNAKIHREQLAVWAARELRGVPWIGAGPTQSLEGVG